MRELAGSWGGALKNLSDRDTDVFIVGGGPAGLATAIAARERGLRVIVADVAQLPIDKACGEGLSPDSVKALRALGVAIRVNLSDKSVSDADLSAPIAGIRFASGNASVQARFPSGSGAGVRRTTLHRLLANRAEEAGATLLWGQQVTGLSGHAVKLPNKTIRAQWIVGADGQSSRVRQWAGLDHKQRESFRFGFRRHYRIPPWSEFVEVHWGNDCQFYITPIGPLEVCVALISRDSHDRIDRVLDGFPELHRRLRGAGFTSHERGAISASRSLRCVTRGPVALVGDASGSVDAITGHGIHLALRQTTALAEALAAGCLAPYQAKHRQLSRLPILMEQMLLLLDRSPWLRTRVLRALENNPAIFERMVAMHVGKSSHAEFALDAISVARPDTMVLDSGNSPKSCIG